MIARAITEILNVTDVTDLATGGVHFSTVPQQASPPYVVFREAAIPEHFKNNTKIVNHTLEIVIVSEKGKDGSAGFLNVETIGAMVHSKLNRFRGISGGKAIDTIVKQGEQVYYDQISMTAIMELNYDVREKISESLADPANYPITVNVYVNDVLQDSNIVNGYESNTFTIS